MYALCILGESRPRWWNDHSFDSPISCAQDGLDLKLANHAFQRPPDGLPPGHPKVMVC